jgi:hypothetical protein
MLLVHFWVCRRLRLVSNLFAVRVYCHCRIDCAWGCATNHVALRL